MNFARKRITAYQMGPRMMTNGEIYALLIIMLVMSLLNFYDKIKSGELKGAYHLISRLVRYQASNLVKLFILVSGNVVGVPSVCI